MITDRGRAVVKILPYVESINDPRAKLRGSLLKYDQPTEPVAVEDLEGLG